jgi:anti-sigma factor RsiW
MDHAKAIETNAAERYLLGELDDAEAEMYEEHYFDCADCADDVREGMRLIEGIRDVETGKRRPDEPPAPVASLEQRRARRLGWMQLTAAAVLTVGIALPRLIPDDDVLHMQPMRALSATRAPQEGMPRFTAGQPLAVPHDIVLDDLQARVAAEIRDAKGKVVRPMSETLSAEQARDGVVISTSELPAGRYTLSILGVRADGNRWKIEEHPFEVVE